MSDDSQESARFFHDFGFYSVARIVPAVLGVVALVVFTRAFSPSAYGKYSLTMAFVSIFTLLNTGWLEQAILRFEPQADDTTFRDTTATILLSLTTVAALVGGLGYVSFFPRSSAYSRFYLGGLSLILLQGVFTTLRTFLRSRLESRRVAIYNVVQAGTKLGAALLLALFVLGDIVGWLWGTVVGTSIATALLLYRTELTRASIEIDRELVGKMFRYGYPLIGMTLGYVLLNFADRILLELLKSSRAVGIYSSNYSIVNRGLPLVLAPIIQAAHPLIMNTWTGDNEEELGELLETYTRYFLLLGVPATVYATVLSRPLSVLFLGDSYHQGYVVIPLVAWGVLLWNLASLGSKTLEVKNRTLTLFAGVTAAVVLNLLLNLLFIPPYGYVGAAFATFTSFTFYLVFVLLISRRYIEWRFPRRTTANVVVGGTLMSAPSAVLVLLGEYTWLTALSTAIPSGLVYVATIYLLGELRDQEIAKSKALAANRW
ncbi:oligosaccharide flippase family protein [Halorussus gelatinilyticus]|uniref:Oligosaccharide flippase family protein n=1 Tax=Halorussus gelatinilyticus TaxID=2937524 RepID=A0A8U0IJK2_9EURY|nr:oligosaccharide flippase family protein [Halorussus gelatinilyticus]UPW01297.1 oligosaccharide flippase family protein [Halorussus gelatinilyticus]